MNERMMRVAPKAAAEFITAFSEGKGKVGDSTWLVWAYEGDYTLADLMQASHALLASQPASPAGAAGTPFDELFAQLGCPEDRQVLRDHARRQSCFESLRGRGSPGFSGPFCAAAPAEEGVPLQPGAEPVWSGAEHPKGAGAQGGHPARRAAAAARVPGEVPCSG